MNEEKLGRRLQAARLQAGLTQQSLCQKANLSYSTLTKIERGAIKSPSIFTIQNIANALGVRLDELMGAASGGPDKTAHKQRSQSGVGFVYFDINGCLVRFYHRAFTRLAAVTGAPADIVETTFWHYNDQICRGEMDLAEFNQALSLDLGTAEPIDWMEYYLDAIEPIPVMHDLVRWASERYRIGLLTNIMPGFIDAMRARELLPDVPYDAIVDSSAVKAIKPESKMYTIATEKAHCPANEILLVDDSRVNLMAAAKHQWHVLWFDDYRPDESVQRVQDALRLAAN
ncbi:MAG TPA: helix-turn-helix domain-containing protein [Candidatus Saccharimonadales bacterium]|nr:helix-turn-helix domain-containing protein [Candidatus Saccharimonadales bacterium]